MAAKKTTAKAVPVKAKRAVREIPGVRRRRVISSHPLANCQPLGDRVIVRRGRQEDKTPGGILLVTTSQMLKQQGEVIAVGPGNAGPDGKPVPLVVQPGDRVIMSSFSGMEVREGSAQNLDEFVIVRAEDIISIMD